MGGEVRRADPVKCSDAGILGREKMFGHGQTYFESLRLCSDRGKIRKLRLVLYIFDLYIHPLVLYKNDTRPAKETAVYWTGDLTYTSHPLTPPLWRHSAFLSPPPAAASTWRISGMQSNPCRPPRLSVCQRILPPPEACRENVTMGRAETSWP